MREGKEREDRSSNIKHELEIRIGAIFDGVVSRKEDD